MIVDTKQPGWDKRTLKNKMGMRAATTGGIYHQGCQSPEEEICSAKIGKGFRYAMATLDCARVGVAAQGVGVAQRALDESVRYANKRHAFGQPIAKLQAIQWMIADMATRVEAARCLTYKAALMQDRGEKFSLEASHGQAVRLRNRPLLCRPRHADSRRVRVYRRILTDRETVPRPARPGNLRGNLGGPASGYRGECSGREMKFGQFEIQTFVEQPFRLDGGTMFGVIPKSIWGKMLPADENNLIPMTVNLFVLKAHGKNMIFDIGLGDTLSDREKKIYGTDGVSHLDRRLIGARLEADGYRLRHTLRICTPITAAGR